MDYQKVFSEIYNELKTVEKEGETASYIPELARVDPEHFGAHLPTIDYQECSIEENEVRFSIQSIAKVFSFVLAYDQLKDDIWKRMGLEPAGTPFNSLV